MSNEINILGKDYLTELEAAHYCGVSNSQWKSQKKKFNLSSFKFMGKSLYRKADLIRILENAWQQSLGEVNTTKPQRLIGANKTAKGTAQASAKSRANKPKQSDWKKNSNFAQHQAKAMH